MSDTKKLYESMYLVSQSEATDLGGVVDHIVEMIAKAGGELVAMKKWDERRLAYEIEKNKRGVFLLCYVLAGGDTIAKLERDANLSERILRLMTLRADHLSVDEARAADARDDLAAEAKLRAERAAGEDGRAAVTVGAPESARQAESEEEAAAEPKTEAAHEAAEAPAGE